MFRSKKNVEKTKLDEVLEELTAEMKNLTGDTPEYAKTREQFSELYKLKDIERPQRVSPDTLAIVAGNLAVAIIVVGHERANVVTSKALSFMTKLR